MPPSLRPRAWRLSLSLLLATGAAIGIAMLRGASSDASSRMPQDQRDYWAWVGSINRDPASAPSAGIELLGRAPHLPAVYVRLAETCAGTASADACRAALSAAAPPDDRVALYREAALLLLEERPEEAVAGWKRLAGRASLAPTLARLVVDRARANPATSWLPEVEAIWTDAVARDTTLGGPSFGLGYAAVLRNEWTAGEALLQRVARRLPDDAQAYRELGRIYYVTGRPEAFEKTLEAGIRAAQASHDLELALTLRGNLGLSVLNWKGDLEKASTLFEEALAQSRLLSLGRSEGFNLYRLANVRVRQHRYTETLALLDSAKVRYAEHVPQQLAEISALRGTTLSFMFRFSEAEGVLEEAILHAEAVRNVNAKIQALIALAELRYQMGQYTAARAVGLDALELATANQAHDYTIAARKVLGDVERLGGDFEAADSHYQRGIALAREANNQARLRELYQRMGMRALDIRDIDAARNYFEMMLEGIDRTDDSQALTRAYFDLGRTYSQFGNLQEAVRLFDLALDAMPAGSAGSLRAMILRDKADALAHLGTHPEALALLEEAHRLSAADKLLRYSVENVRGSAYLLQEKYREALAHYQRAETLEDELQWSSVHWEVLYGKAIAYWRLRRQEEADGAFRDAIAIVETLRDNLNSVEDRSFFVQNKVQVYEDYSRFLEEQGRVKEAFHYNERARSRGLVDLLYATQRGARPDPNSSVDQAIEMKRRVQAIEQEIAAAEYEDSNPASSAYRGNRAAFLRRERLRADSLYRRLELNLYGEQELYRFNPLQADSVQRILRPDEAIVVYNLRDATRGNPGRHASVVYVLLPDTMLVRGLDVAGGDLPDAVRFFRDQISNSDTGPGNNWRPAAQRLYRELVEPVRALLPASVRHLNIVPEGILHYLPFAALQNEDGRFLVEDFTLSVVPSATILKLARARNPRRWSYMLLLADPDGRLPGARKEVTSIAAGAPNRRYVLVGQDAKQSTFEEVAEQYDIIHFATHGNFISRAPWRSHLELYGDELSVEEIGHLRLEAYLVTLSACETALSGGLVTDVPSGDEWVGLNQAFLAAGTPTVMASLWSIDDRVSSTFMKGFYDRLGHEGKAHALAQMQRRFIQNPELRHPFYWAAFTVFGDPL